MKTLSKQMILTTPRFEVWHDVVLDMGIEKNYYYINKNDAVCIILINTDHKVALAKVNRYNTEAIRYELLGGRIELGELPIEAAKRELLEEANVSSESWILLSSIRPLPSVVSENVYLYCSKLDSSFHEVKNTDDTENILGIEFYEINDIITMIMEGKIVNSIDALALFVYREKFNKGEITW